MGDGGDEAAHSLRLDAVILQQAHQALGVVDGDRAGVGADGEAVRAVGLVHPRGQRDRHVLELHAAVD